MEITKVLKMQEDYGAKAEGIPLGLRRELLKRLLFNIEKFETEIVFALREDLGKSSAESYLTEISMAKSEIKMAIKYLPIWARDRYFAPSVASFPSVSHSKRQPFGRVLILSPWNYPFYLAIAPLVSAIAGGNTVILKPSKKSIQTSRLLERLISKTFAPWQVYLASPFCHSNEEILSYKYDLIFFTGSKRVGKIVMEKCSKSLTPCILELGGKSPAIVDSSACLTLASKKILWGKLLNSGQTCVAPDYVLCHEECLDDFLFLLNRYYKKLYKHGIKNKSYPKIIDKEHFERARELLESAINEGGELVFGGELDEKSRKMGLSALVLDRENALANPIMKEEIFAPILPIIPYKSFEELRKIISQNKNPLALYSFGERAFTKKCVREFSFGGGCENDAIMHLSNPRLAFGGVGESGLGAYHGKNGFLSFTHEKSILSSPRYFDLPLRYPPFRKGKARLIREII